MSATTAVLIVDTETGETQTFQDSRKWQGEYSEFWWGAANGASDDFRAMYFAEAGGDINLGDVEPSETEGGYPVLPGRFVIPFVILPDGTRVEIDGVS